MRINISHEDTNYSEIRNILNRRVSQRPAQSFAEESKKQFYQSNPSDLRSIQNLCGTLRKKPQRNSAVRKLRIRDADKYQPRRHELFRNPKYSQPQSFAKASTKFRRGIKKTVLSVRTASHSKPRRDSAQKLRATLR